MNRTRTLLRSALVVLLAVSGTGCIVLPLDPWGGHGRRGGRHYEAPPQSQPQPYGNEAPGRRPRDGR